MPRSSAHADPEQLSLFEAGSTRAGAGAAPRRPADMPPPNLSAEPTADRSDDAAPGWRPVVFRHPRAQREVVLAGHLVAYALRRARRRSIGFVVGSEGLTVSAPRWVGIGEVESALQSKSGWVLRKLQEQAERSRRLEAARIEWRDGTSFPYLGESVLVVLDPRVVGAVLDDRAPSLPGVARWVLQVGLPPSAQPMQIRDAVHGWLQSQARRIFTERCEHFAARLGVRVARLSLSSATTRWGSASADGSIRLHWRLVHMPPTSIDYVVAHELAHLREMNHSAAFWGVVRSVMPDYEEARRSLRHHALPPAD